MMHRYHKRDSLLKFEKDKRRWIYWLFKAIKQLGIKLLKIIAYTTLFQQINWVRLNAIDIFPRLNFSPSLYSNKNYHFSKILPHVVTYPNTVHKPKPQLNPFSQNIFLSNTKFKFAELSPKWALPLETAHRFVQTKEKGIS
ncbi:MAG: hypothetical protein B6I22_02900 [Desulfobacteraceae bacterium 4572_123]|nr:MAG: hypothetical protein B6I22_02900 [Desulfobacteraceae bacterium 4572_123]